MMGVFFNTFFELKRLFISAPKQRRFRIIKALCPSGKAPIARVLRLISRFRRSMVLLAGCSQERGNSS